MEHQLVNANKDLNDFREENVFFTNILFAKHCSVPGCNTAMLGVSSNSSRSRKCGRKIPRTFDVWYFHLWGYYYRVTIYLILQ